MRRVKAQDYPADPLIRDAQTLAHFIRASRTQSGITLEEAALATGIAKSTMQKLENDPSTVSLAIALEVARQLGIALFAVPAEERENVRRRIAAGTL